MLSLICQSALITVEGYVETTRDVDYSMYLTMTQVNNNLLTWLSIVVTVRSKYY